MNELLSSLRADLLSRRMLPLAAVAVLGFAVAVGYALAGSGGGAAPRTGAVSSAAPQPASLAVTAAAPDPNVAESETPGGLRYQTQSALRDPFTPLPSSGARQSSASAATSETAASSATSGGGGSSRSGSEAGKASSGGGSGSATAKSGEPAPTPAKPSKPTPSPSKPKPSYPYDVSVLFGQLPASGQPVTLPPYQNLQPQRPLPSATEARIALERVSGDAKSAVFALLQPPILRGPALCLPSPSECQQLALEVGKAEELEYVEASGQTLVYELKTVSIVKRSSQTAG
jgi:hypothetical protein